ncbi:MAG: O-methyltransferase [Anaerolineae bacterium]|nr:O-methyltransferase [Anaerolineae bacterium]
MSHWNEVTQDALDQYVRDLFVSEDDVLQSIQTESRSQGLPQIHIRPEEGLMIQFLLTAIGARHVVEIGTLGGYSSAWIARALPPDGHLITIENDPGRARSVDAFFERVGLGERIEVMNGLAPACLETIASRGPFDAIFMDAPKDDYPAYLEWSLDNIRSGGLIMAHNAFWGGAVVGAAWRDEHQLQGLLSFTRSVAYDKRLLGTIIPVGDGIVAAIRL